MRALIVFAVVFPPKSGLPPGKQPGLPQAHLTARVQPQRSGFGSFLGRHRRGVMVVVLVAVVAAAYPPVVGGLAASLFASRLSERLGRPVTVARGQGGFGQVTLRGVVIAGHPGGPPLVTAGEIAVPFGVVIGRGTAPVVISELNVHAVRGGPEDNVNEIIAHLSAGRKSAAATPETKTETTPETKTETKTGMKIPAVAIESGRIFIHDSESGLRFETASLRGVLNPSQQLAFQLGGVVGVLALSVTRTSS